MTDKNLETIWDWMHIEDELEPADIIIGIGSYDDRVAQRCVELFQQNFAREILFTGKYGRNLTARNTTEAEDFRNVAVEAGVPETSILLETEATNTGENIQFSHKLLLSTGRDYHTAIVVSKPYMTRRAQATFQKQWPSLHTLHTAWQETLEEHLDRFEGIVSAEIIIGVILGDFQRMIDYPDRGFQAAVDIPTNVMKSFDIAKSHYDAKPVT